MTKWVNRMGRCPLWQVRYSLVLLNALADIASRSLKHTPLGGVKEGLLKVPDGWRIKRDKAVRT